MSRQSYVQQIFDDVLNTFDQHPHLILLYVMLTGLVFIFLQQPSIPSPDENSSCCGR